MKITKIQFILIVLLVVGIVAVSMTGRHRNTEGGKSLSQWAVQRNEDAEWTAPIPKNMPVEAMRDVMRGKLSPEEAEAPYK